MFFWYENDDDNKDKYMLEILYVDFGKFDYSLKLLYWLSIFLI